MFRRSRPTTVRTRILGWYVLLLAVALVVALLIQRSFLLTGVAEDADAALEQEVAELRALAGGTDPDTGEPFGDDVEAIFDLFLARNVGVEGEGIITYVDGSGYKADLVGSTLAQPELTQRWATVTEPVRDQVDTDRGPVRFVAIPLDAPGAAEPAGVFVAAVNLESRLAQVNEATRLAALVYGTTFLVASLMAWLAAGQVLRPLRTLRETAERISDTDLASRIHVTGDDEIAGLAETFNHMLDRLEEAFASQRRFVDDAGHELRTPITIVRGQLELMGDDPQDRAEAMELVTGELDRMSRIVEDLLVLARHQQPDFVLPRPLDLDAFVEELGAKAATLADRPVAVDVPAPVVVVGDGQRLTQAVMNLVRNALEHGGPDSKITLGGTVEHGRDVALWVHDTGPGIAPEEIDHVMKRFGRGARGRRGEGGAGLGLSIVDAVARAHGGRVELASQPGSTTASIHLPDSIDVPGEAQP